MPNLKKKKDKLISCNLFSFCTEGKVDVFVYISHFFIKTLTSIHKNNKYYISNSYPILGNHRSRNLDLIIILMLVMKPSLIDIVPHTTIKVSDSFNEM